MILYHITKRKNLSGIFIEGLVPAKYLGMNISGDKCKHVFLTNDIDYIMEFHCGKKWIKKHDCVLLHIDTTGINCEPHQHRDGATYTLSNNEFVVERVAPEKIIKVTEL